MIERVAEPGGWNLDALRLGGNFLQAWQWGEFQRALGRDVLRLREDGAMAQMIRMSLPLGKSYWYCPRGPLGKFEDMTLDADLAKAMFVRLEPQTPDLVPSAASKVRDVQPGQTLVVDLAQEREAIMAAMHEKWRYNIRLAERKGVKVYMTGERGTGASDVFWDLLEETTERDRFRAHGKEYYRSMLEALSGDPATDGKTRPVARLVFAEHDGRVLAANLMVYFGDTAVYLHGASSRVRRELMAPHLLHWTAMLDAKGWGYKAYDFWGVAPEGAEDHPWAGITRFKRGFGGNYVAYPGTYDLPIDRFWYGLYSTAQKLRGR
ncbi:MAG TPA: peptidoglycan bridge formation glycyltransferase FemA/FemB family protein [Candidatus Baltobacteraceae bacterium]|nr:peptidoglycan bridge formation glycyltransferase FemA/FemB family protein [Candidatus Baltobacteraceae bacterium]